MENLKVAVVGAGIYGIHHVDVYKQNPFVELVAVCDFNAEIRGGIEKKYKVNTYATVEEMLANEKLNAVSIATPDHLHVEPAVACINHGLDVLIEKPLATTVRDCQIILDAAEKNQVRVAVDFHKRWDPAAIYTYNQLKESENGYPIRGYMNMDDTIDVPTKWFKWGNASDPIDFLGVHCVDLMRWYMNCEVTEVYSVGSKKLLPSLGVDTYDSVQSIITFENDCAWTLENSWILPSGFAKVNDSRTAVLTSEKYIRINNQDRGVEMADKEKTHTPNVFFFNDFNNKVVGFGADPINSFIDSLIDGSDFVADVYDGLQAAKVTDAIHESLRTGERVKLQ
ncbi:Gfo/Idh/MocA family protein [Candidatus Enterococcus murrayae]|uniref:Gfo/Idh/MocA family oxidoreductase n=1 Tax=Candidatus Enterococcus murrayae TaxID=2815321 RepID=A0ABS3HEU3_9ENTE|nr:Gfo/Idh/MocA family oxidoreductase [Enterococcus sp. MJM16]MBO0451976.1 Gfo/Idh/MocA family oxidoreductase [Enterococcus sp. MJM16]